MPVKISLVKEPNLKCWWCSAHSKVVIGGICCRFNFPEPLLCLYGIATGSGVKRGQALVMLAGRSVQFDLGLLQPRSGMPRSERTAQPLSPPDAEWVLAAFLQKFPSRVGALPLPGAQSGGWKSPRKKIAIASPPLSPGCLEPSWMDYSLLLSFMGKSKLQEEGAGKSIAILPPKNGKPGRIKMRLFLAGVPWCELVRLLLKLAMSLVFTAQVQGISQSNTICCVKMSTVYICIHCWKQCLSFWFFVI